MANRRRFSKTEVLDMICAPSSDNESEDDLEEDDDFSSTFPATVPLADTEAEQEEVMTGADDGSVSAESDTLYILAQYSEESDTELAQFTDESDTESSDSDDDETDWKKEKKAHVAVNFDAVHVLPAMPFSDDNRPVDFFHMFLMTGS